MESHNFKTVTFIIVYHFAVSHGLQPVYTPFNTFHHFESDVDTF